MRGKFIVLEGLEGAGKTTAHQVILAQLEKAGKSVVQTREPGGTPLAEKTTPFNQTRNRRGG